MTAAAAGELARLQRWMQAVIAHPEGPAAGAAAEEARALAPDGAADVGALVTPSETLTALERVGIYADMVLLRLVDVLREDFPAVRALVGSDRFDRLARAYVRACPSTHYSLNVLGRRFPGFLAERDEDELEVRAFAAELAALEDGIEQCFDASESEPLAPAALETVAPEAWATARLEPSPHVRLLAFAHPVNAWFQTFRDGTAGPAPAPIPSWLLLYRTEGRVWRSDLTAEQHAILAALVAGEPLPEALAAGADAAGMEPEDLSPSLGPWFQRWAGLGLFSAVRT